MNSILNITKESVLHRALADVLKHADVEIGGNRPWDIHLNHPKVPDRVFSMGSLGLGEAYMEGHWETQQLDELFNHILRAHLDQKVRPLRIAVQALQSRIFNLQSTKRAWKVGEMHYDLGNDFYEAMLDPRMTYTCGYWEGGATTLAEAQEAKLELVCRKLELKSGMRLLDIGCGWGSLMSYAAEHYDVECLGVTISKEQADWAKTRYAGMPLEFRLQDYRTLNEPFDRIASIGMFEHVGHKNYRTYMEVARRCLKDDGLFLLHTIGKNQRPNGDLPSIGQIGDATEGLFVVEDLQNFGADYDKTLMAWYSNFEAAWPRFKEQYGESFFKMWRYYLLSCAGGFRARDIQLWQWVLSKEGVVGGYRRPEPVAKSTALPLTPVGFDGHFSIGGIT
jgi:cyclopropane-fatty-acyl-phospholipid synthase